MEWVHRNRRRLAQVVSRSEFQELYSHPKRTFFLIRILFELFHFLIRKLQKAIWIKNVMSTLVYAYRVSVFIEKFRGEKFCRLIKQQLNRKQNGKEFQIIRRKCEKFPRGESKDKYVRPPDRPNYIFHMSVCEYVLWWLSWRRPIDHHHSNSSITDNWQRSTLIHLSSLGSF